MFAKYLQTDNRKWLQGSEVYRWFGREVADQKPVREAEKSVCVVTSYWPRLLSGSSFFLPFMAQARSARAMKTRKEKTRIHNLPYGLSKRG